MGKNWFKERTNKGEKIGGGFIVFRRHSSSGRIAPTKTGMPFEYPTYDDAIVEAQRLAEFHPGKQFCVFQQMGSAEVPAVESEDAEFVEAAE